MSTPIVRYRKRPVAVDTIQWTGSNLADVQAFTGPSMFRVIPVDEQRGAPGITASVYDRLHVTWVAVYTGQHIVRGVVGELYPIAEDVLADTYERADSAPDFFQPHRIYVRRVHGDLAEFDVRHIETHPEGHRVAFGFYRRQPRTAWHEYTSSDFHDGWTDAVGAGEAS